MIFAIPPPFSQIESFNCGDELSDYVPTAQTPIKTVLLAFHIFQQEGSVAGNFVEGIPAHDAFLNAVFNRFYLQIPSTETAKQLFIIDQQGRLVQQSLLSQYNEPFLLDIAQEPKGIYYVRIVGDNTSKTLKIVKQ